MKKINVSCSVAEAAESITSQLTDKGFKIFAYIDHQANASSVDLELPAARSIIFGNPMAGTKLMQKDITMSFDLPLRIAVVDQGGQTVVIHQTIEGYCKQYDVEGHPVLEKIEALFSSLAATL